MRNQARSRSDMAGDRTTDHGRDADWPGADYQLRPGHHPADPSEPEQEYDPRLYAPNPDEPYGYDDDGQPIYYEPDARPGKSGPSGGALMVAAVLAIAAIGGAGAVGYKMLGSSSGEPPLIRAETEPVKTAPQNAAETQQNKAIYDRVEAPNAKSKVVSREEQPVDLPAAPTSEPRGDGSRIILPGGPASVGTTPPDTQGSEPRRVKTVAIRPDVPIAPPAGPKPPADPIAEAARTGEPPRASEFDNGILTDAVLPRPEPRLGAAPRPATPAVPQPQPQAARIAAPQTASVPQAGPAPQAPAPQRSVQTPPAAAQQQRQDPQQVAALAPRAPVAPPAPAAVRPSTGGFVVQVTSQRSETDARAAYASLQKRFPQVLGPYQASIQPAQVADRGTYYRVRVGPFSSSTDASTVCNNLRSAGGDCVVSRN